MGWLVGAGISYELVNDWVLRPTISYRSLSRDLVVEGETFNVDLNHLSFGLGISKTF
ncbi:MAG: hypothetical protein WA839_11615 [Flavobacteriaceae bacterium]